MRYWNYALFLSGGIFLFVKFFHFPLPHLCYLYLQLHILLLKPCFLKPKTIPPKFGWCNSLCLSRNQMCVLIPSLLFTCWWFCATHYMSLWLISLLIDLENNTCPKNTWCYENYINLHTGNSFEKKWNLKKQKIVILWQDRRPEQHFSC